MDFWVKTGTFNTPASGTTVITTTGKGTNPKGIIFHSTFATANDTNQDHYYTNFGFADDKNNNRSILANYQLNAANSFRSSSSTICLRILNLTDTVIVAATCVMNVNDVTITYTTFAANHRVQYTIFGGTDCETFVNHALASASPITGVGFQSNLILWATSGTGINATSEHTFQSIGAFSDNGTTIDQWGLYSYAGDNAPLNSGSILRTADSLGQINLDFAAWKAVATVIGTDGFTWTGTNGDAFIYMCVRAGTDHTSTVDVGTFTKPTGGAPATGSFSPGFVPQAYILASANEVNETDAVANDAELSWGAYDGTDAQAHITTAQENDQLDRHNRFITGEVLQLSTSLLDNNIQASGTPQTITDNTPDIEWNPNTANATIIGYIAFELQPVYDQDGFQFINDDGSETTATDLAAEDTNVTQPKTTNTRLRVQTDITAGEPPSATRTLQYKEVGDPDAEWRDVPLT